MARAPRWFALALAAHGRLNLVRPVLVRSAIGSEIECARWERKICSATSVLYLIGHGPVRGFAVTFGVGIMTSLFATFMLSRPIIS